MTLSASVKDVGGKKGAQAIMIFPYFHSPSGKRDDWVLRNVLLASMQRTLGLDAGTTASFTGPSLNVLCELAAECLALSCSTRAK